jgi:hypothetical protein
MADSLFPSIDDESIDTFPVLNVGDAFLQNDESGEAPPIPYGFTWKFDFNKGDLFVDSSYQFVEVEERDTVHEWVAHTLNTERWETPIFNGDIGTEVNTFFGARTTTDGGTLARIEEEILTAVRIHDRIISVGVVLVLPVDYDIFAVFRYTTDDSVLSTEVARV